MCNSKTKRITIRLNETDYNYLVGKSADEDMPIAYIVRELIKQDRKLFQQEVAKYGKVSQLV